MINSFKNIILKTCQSPLFSSKLLFKHSNNNNNNNRLIFKYYCNSNNNYNNKNNDNNEITSSILEISYKEKEIKRIINLLENSQFHKNNLLKLSKFNEMGIQDKIINGEQINGSATDTVKQIKEYYSTQQSINQMNSLSKEYKDYLEIAEMSKIENDIEMQLESVSLLHSLYGNCSELEINALMNGQEDHKGCFIEIQSGVGGNDSMDWTKILFNMYCKWANRKGFNVEIIDTTPGEFGYRRATLKIDIGNGNGNDIAASNAFGWMRTEMGIHKLIRISPFDTSGKRHTSFSSVVVYPIADDSISIDMSPKDLIIETTKSSGAGGQHVNTTESAVRITHIPTGLSVFSCGERSQHQNKSTGLALLKSKIYTMELKKRMELEKSFRDDLGKNGWGSDSIVRTYTMHPQERVKDQRTGEEVLQISKILDGEEELDYMIKKALSN